MNNTILVADITAVLATGGQTEEARVTYSGRAAWQTTNQEVSLQMWFHLIAERGGSTAQNSLGVARQGRKGALSIWKEKNEITIG